MLHLDYTTLFRTAAEQHVDLRHSATEMHFGRLILTGWPLTKLDIDELLNAQKAKIRLPILLLESYDARYTTGSGADNVRKVPTGAIIVLDQVGAGDYDLRDKVIDTCERIGEEVLGYAIEQYRKKSIKLDTGTISSEKVGPIGSAKLWGVRFDFQLPELANKPLAYKADKFLS